MFFWFLRSLLSKGHYFLKFYQKNTKLLDFFEILAKFYQNFILPKLSPKRPSFTKSKLIYQVWSHCQLCFRPRFFGQRRQISHLFISRHSSNSLKFDFTNFLSHFLNKLMLKRNYFLILSLVKKSFHHCVYILSRNREKQLCNKAIK
jgi:hypothetical protein